MPKFEVRLTHAEEIEADTWEDAEDNFFDADFVHNVTERTVSIYMMKENN